MTYHEAWELSYFGANVLHPRTTLPAMKYQIPITIRNFFNQPSPGGWRVAAWGRRGRGQGGSHGGARMPTGARCITPHNAAALGCRHGTSSLRYGRGAGASPAQQWGSLQQFRQAQTGPELSGELPGRGLTPAPCARCPHPAPGTRISDLSSDIEVYKGKNTIKGFATIDNVTLINVEVRAAGGPRGNGSRMRRPIQRAGAGATAMIVSKSTCCSRSPLRSSPRQASTGYPSQPTITLTITP